MQHGGSVATLLVLVLARTAAPQPFVASVPVILRKGDNVTLLRLPLARDHPTASSAASVCAAYSIAPGRCRYLLTLLADALHGDPAQIVAVASVHLQYAGATNPSPVQTPALLAFRRRGETPEHAAAAFCVEHGVVHCGRLVHALEWRRWTDRPLLRTGKIQLVSGFPPVELHLHQCEQPIHVAHFVCVLTGIAATQCDKVVQAVQALAADAAAAPADCPRPFSGATLVQLGSEHSSGAKAATSRRAQRLEALIGSERHAAVLRWLVSPEQPEEFFATHWEKSPVLLRRKPDHHAELFEESDFVAVMEAFLKPTSIPQSQLYVMAVNGTFEVQSQQFQNLGDVYLSGQSAIVNNIEGLWHPAADLSDSLGPSFLPTGLNLYATPPRAIAFPQHSDDQDVFILQVSGRKHWSVYDAPVPLAYKTHQFGKPKHRIGVYNAVPDSLELLVSQELTAGRSKDMTQMVVVGDLLYIPRGYIHNASCGAEQGSVHITFTVQSSEFSWTPILLHGVHQSIRHMRASPGLRSKALLQEVSAALASLRHRPRAVHEATESFKRGEIFRQMHKFGLRAPEHELHSSSVGPASVVTYKEDCTSKIAQVRWPRKRESLEKAWTVLSGSSDQRLRAEELPHSDILTQLLVVEQLVRWSCVSVTK